MNNSKKTISVIIPAYNIEDYIERAIKSVLAQTRLPDEIIVVDDGSSDGTAERVKKFGDSVNYIYQDNKGLSGARNTGIKKSNSEWIALLDGDDEWTSEHLKLHEELLERNPDVMWSTGNYYRCLCNEDRRAASFSIDKINSVLGGRDWVDNYLSACVNGVYGWVCTMTINKKVFEEVGYFSETQTFAEDLDMIWRITNRFPRAGYVAKPTAVYHMTRPGALSQISSVGKIQVMTELLDRHFALAKAAGNLKEFNILAGQMVTSWIRTLLFENKPYEIIKLVDKFGHLLSGRFKFILSILLVNPTFTSHVCHVISKVVRKLKLRKKLVRTPGRRQKA